MVLGYDDIRGYKLMDAFSVRSLEEVETVSRIPDFLLMIKKWFLQRMRIITIFTAVRMVREKLWEVKEISQEKNSVDFFRISPDGENGFPGEFSIVVKYEFTEGKRTEDFLQRTL